MVSSYLVGGKSLQGVEYYPPHNASSFSSTSSSSSSFSFSSAYTYLSDSSLTNQIFSHDQPLQQQQQQQQDNNSVILLRRLGLCSLDLSHRLLQVSQTKTSCWHEVDASRNQLTYIPSQIQLFTGLTQLTLANNTIHFIPPELYQHLVCLQTLILSENQIEVIPHDMPFYLSRLVTLHLDGNQLATLPESIGQWKHMCELKLGSEFGGNQVQVLPTSISEMTNLVDLNVSFNQLQSILPGTFIHLSNLQHLNLSHNQIMELPRILFRDNQQLSTIDLSDNQIRVVPHSIVAEWIQLTQLKLLNLADNQLHILPAELLDQHMTQVIIKGNPISYQHFQHHQQQGEGEGAENVYHQMMRDLLQTATPMLGHSSSPLPSSSRCHLVDETTILHEQPDITEMLLEQARQHNILTNRDDNHPMRADVPQFDHVLHQQQDNIIPPSSSHQEEEEQQTYLLHSLREIALRTLLTITNTSTTSPNNNLLSLVPDHIAMDLGSQQQSCTLCHQPYISEWISSIQLKHYGGNPSVVRQIRFCGTTCWLNYRKQVAQQAIAMETQQQRRDALQYIQQHGLEPGSMDWIMAAVSAASLQEEQADILANAIL